MSFRVHAHFFRYTETEVTRPLYLVRGWGGVLLRRVVGMGFSVSEEVCMHTKAHTKNKLSWSLRCYWKEFFYFLFCFDYLATLPMLTETYSQNLKKLNRFLFCFFKKQKCRTSKKQKCPSRSK